MNGHTSLTKKWSVILLLFLLVNILTDLTPKFVFAVTSDITSGQNATYLSPVKMAPIVFTGLGVSWAQKLPENTAAEVSVRFQDKGNWGEWYALDPDLSGSGDADPNSAEDFITVNPTKVFQYKVILHGDNDKLSPIADNLKFTYINAGQKVIQSKGSLLTANDQTGVKSTGKSGSIMPKVAFAATGTGAQQSAGAILPGGLSIISRAEWGANESLRLYKSTNPKPVLVKTESDFQTKYADELKIVRTVDKDGNGNTLTWPQQYPERVTKIIIHHTASVKDLDDPMKAIRDIYYFHTVTRGWGDIGYNYIIDQKGNIYEGRYGGDSVVGAHAGRGNIGSIGIAILGNYEDNTVPDPAIRSLVALIQAKTQEYNIDPTGSSMFRGENLPNIIGHRDIEPTTCPGANLYALQPGIRMAVKSGLTSVIIDRGKNLLVNKQNDFQVSQKIPFYDINPGQPQEIIMTLKNTGQTAWNSNTYFIMNRDANANNFFMSSGIVKSGTTGREIKPGESAVFKLTVQAGYKSGITAVEVFPMINGSIKVEKYLSMPVLIRTPIYDYEVQSLTVPKPYIKVGEETDVVLELKNTGNITWKKQGTNKFMLGADQPRDHTNKLLRLPSNRLATLMENEVPPGGIGHFKFKIKGPKNAGPYREYFTPLIEGITWLQNKGNRLDVYVYNKEYESRLVGTSVEQLFTGGTKKKMWFEIQNIGGVVWNSTGTDSMTFETMNRGNLTMEGLQLEQASVAPGETGRISFTLGIPEKEGFYHIQIRPKIGNHLLVTKNYFIQVKKATSQNQQTTQQLTQQTTQQTTQQQAPVIASPLIRIDLGFSGSPVIAANGTYSLQAGGKTLASLSASQQASVTFANQKYTVAIGQQTYDLTDPPRFVPDSGTILRIDNWNRVSSGNPATLLNQFRGVLETRWYNAELQVINELPIEDYLKGTGEIADSQPLEKIKAIIVVARTYAMFYVKVAEKFPGAPFNLTDDPQTSQKYVGYAAEKNAPNTLKAIAATSGEVVTYQGKLVKTPYFSSDDGRTRSAQEVWGWTDTPYLMSVPDLYCKGLTLSGHGVGLSGCGSLGMAQAGKTYQEIIKYYYQGVQVQKITP